MRKTFKPGDAVLVQREASFVPAWEPATYIERADMRGWHHVDLPQGRERRIDSQTGYECGPDNPRGFLTRHLFVPSRRIKAKSST
jgi:hypothetical protein